MMLWQNSKYQIYRVVVTLAIQHAMRMIRIILSSVACLAVPHFCRIIS